MGQRIRGLLRVFSNYTTNIFYLLMGMKLKFEISIIGSLVKIICKQENIDLHFG